MTLTDNEQDLVTNLLATRRQDRDLRRQLRMDDVVQRHRRARADGQPWIHGLVTAAGVDLDQMGRRRADSTARARAYSDRQRSTIVDHSPHLARQQAAAAVSRLRASTAQHRLSAAAAYQLTTVDTAVTMQAWHATPDANNQVDVLIGPQEPQNNVVRVYQTKQTSPDPEFHIPGIWIVDVDWVFRLTVTDNVLLNAITFVQALGADSLFASGWFFGDSYAQIDFATRLDMFTVGPQPLQIPEPLGAGDQDEGPQRYLHSDWWDVLGQFDNTVYDYQSTLIDNGFSKVAAGSTVFVIVSAELSQSADGNAFCVSDFLDGGLRLNVPAVYVSTFPDNLIP
jgi:hypothetical protein